MTGEDQHEIVRLRRHLADAKANRDEAAWFEKMERARAESRIITALEGDLGKNEAERNRTLLLGLDTDHSYRVARSDLRDAELEVALAEAQIEAWTDRRRREREALQRETNMALLQAAGLVEVGP